MNKETLDTIMDVVKHGGPTAVAFLCLFFYFRMEKKLEQAEKRNHELEDRFYAMSNLQNQTMAKLELSMTLMKELLSNFLGRGHDDRR